MKKLAALKLLQAQVDEMRSQLRISAPNEVVYFAPLKGSSEESVVIEADGFGGAELSIVEGNFPIDFVARVQKKFRSETRAVAAAEKLVN
jgi:hypothetical protein